MIFKDLILQEKEEAGLVQIKCFKWKDYEIEWFGNCRYMVNAVGYYESSEEALNEVKLCFRKN